MKKRLATVFYSSVEMKAGKVGNEAGQEADSRAGSLINLDKVQTSSSKISRYGDRSTKQQDGMAAGKLG